MKMPLGCFYLYGYISFDVVRLFVQSMSALLDLFAYIELYIMILISYSQK